MKALCWILMGVLGMILFFWMMISGWGLEIKAVFPIVIYYVFWLVSLITRMTIEKIEEKTKGDSK